MDYDTTKKYIAHFYFTLAFIFCFLAVEQAIPFADQYGTYAALVLWVFMFGFCLIIPWDRVWLINRLFK